MIRRNGKPQHTAAIPQPLANWQHLALRVTLSLALACLFLWLLSARLTGIDITAVTATIAAVAPQQWLLALTCTGLSFWAVGHYDAVLHQHFATGLPARMTRRAGICAIAVSQMLGLGVITGAILRWRMLPGQSLWLATRLTAAVALSFLAGWAVVTACVILTLPDAPFKPAAGATLIIACAAACLCLAAPRLPGIVFRWPNSFTLARLLVLCAIDTLAAAAAFYALCPPDLALPMQVLLPAFLLALGAGLASGTPGGIGAFEVTLLALLPAHPETGVMGAILAWRIVYFAVPAAFGGLIAAFGPRGVQAQAAPAARPLYQSPRAEAQILLQGEHCLTATTPAETWLTARTNHLLVALFDPIGTASPGGEGLTALQIIATREGRIAVLYKCTARTAALARQRQSAAHSRQRQSAWRIAREAWLDPRSFSLTTAPRAGLRRKLRHATVAGVTISGPADARTAPLPLAQMQKIATAWAETHGGERGFSIGRFAPAYVQGQRVYLAHQHGRLIAFITLHEGHAEWTLDLMRHGPKLPDGTMHLLLHTAITDAKRLDLPRLSLAAVPEHAFAPPKWRVARLVLQLFGTGTTGLARFKSTFAPHWQNLYLVAPNRLCLALAACALARAIHAPRPLPPQIEHLHEEYEFAPIRRAWHRR